MNNEKNVEPTSESSNDAKIVMRSLPSDTELSRIFKSYSDCYADTGHSERGFMQEGEVIQAMTEQGFIEAVKLLGNDA